MAGVPYIFGNATTSIPLTNLDANFNTGLTIGNTTVGLGNTVTTLGNVTLNNVTIASGTNNVVATQIANGTSNVVVTSSGGAVNIATNGTQAVTIDTSQNVGIGTTSPSSFGQLVVVTSGNPIIYTGSTTSGSAGGISIQGSGAGSYPSLNFAQTATNYWTIGQRGDTNLYLYRQSGSGIVIIPNNPLQVATTIGVGTAPATSGAGISFPATQSASSDANTLDDYEEGTWTPTLSASTSGTITTTDRSGTYTKVGNIVTVQGYFNVASVSSPVGDFRVGGLPFTANATYGFGSASIQPYGFAITTTVTAYYALQVTNVTYFTIRGFLNGDQVSNIANNVKASTGMQFTVTYQVA